jgi:uncharacterized protein (DUF1015 family)
MKEKIIRTVALSALVVFVILNIVLWSSNYVEGKYVYQDENGVKHEIILYDNTYNYSITDETQVETEQGFFIYNKSHKHIHLDNVGTFEKQTIFSIANNGAYYTSVRAITLQLVYGVIIITSAIIAGLDNYNIKNKGENKALK